MEKLIESMTYIEFKNYTNDRACDGQWSLEMAIACIDIRKKIDRIKAKGLFKRKATEELQENEWQKIISEFNK